nr:DNA-formamidopyrimidine glycosylase [uncultured Anaeromusa sp.]
MPELPEVETICRTLGPLLVGRRIEHCDVWLSRLIKTPAAEFVQRIEGRQVQRLRRRGKYLLLEMEADVLVIHLRMTGRLEYRAAFEATERRLHDRMRFVLDDGSQLLYHDVRTFGTFHLVSKTEVSSLPGLSSLGPEPFEENFSVAYLQERLQKSRSRIKSFLLRQDVVAGLGNIYVDESLFLAGVNPLRTAASLTKEETEKLHQAIRKVLKQGIAHGGTSIRDYRDGLGRSGGNQRLLCVYGRGGEPCLQCGQAISRAAVAGRGTHWCSSCQPYKGE